MQQAQQQHLQPEARVHAVAQLLLAAPQLGLPFQQPRLADAPGQGGQLVAQLGRDAGELQPIRRHPRQHQIPQQAGQALE